jgi:hypothetical protein
MWRKCGSVLQQVVSMVMRLMRAARLVSGTDSEVLSGITGLLSRGEISSHNGNFFYVMSVQFVVKCRKKIKTYFLIRWTCFEVSNECGLVWKFTSCWMRPCSLVDHWFKDFRMIHYLYCYFCCVFGSCPCGKCCWCLKGTVSVFRVEMI